MGGWYQCDECLVFLKDPTDFIIHKNKHDNNFLPLHFHVAGNSDFSPCSKGDNSVCEETEQMDPQLLKTCHDFLKPFPPPFVLLNRIETHSNIWIERKFSIINHRENTDACENYILEEYQALKEETHPSIDSDDDTGNVVSPNSQSPSTSTNQNRKVNKPPEEDSFIIPIWKRQDFNLRPPAPSYLSVPAPSLFQKSREKTSASDSNSFFLCRCRVCGEVFTTARAHDKHVKQKHSVGSTMADANDKQMKPRHTVRVRSNSFEKRLHDIGSGWWFLCELCNRIYTTPGGLEQHLQRIHGGRERNGSDDHVKSTVPTSVTTSKDILNHKRKNDHSKQECRVCHKFITSGNMQRHLSVHTRRDDTQETQIIQNSNNGFVSSNAMNNDSRLLPVSFLIYVKPADEAPLEGNYEPLDHAEIDRTSSSHSNRFFPRKKRVARLAHTEIWAPNKKRYECTNCLKIFCSRYSLQRHEMKLHPR